MNFQLSSKLGVLYNRLLVWVDSFYSCISGAMSDPYKILFASRHFYLDQSNGASISTRSLLQELVKR